MKVIDYCIISEESRFELSEKVVRLCSQGWVPQGGVFVEHFSSVPNVHYQAMVKYEEVK